MSTRASSTTGTTKTRTPRARSTKPANARAEVTDEAIAVRAYEIHVSGMGGDEVDNWLRAERELTARI